MAVQLITNKKITKFDTNDPNYKPLPKPDPEEIDGNIIEEDVYGEKKHTYQPDNGNLQMNEFMTGVMNKLDGLTVNPDIVQKSRAVEVDIKREIAIGKADMSDIKWEEYKGKVNNKLDKLKKQKERAQLEKMKPQIFKEYKSVKQIYFISAESGQGTENLERGIVEYLLLKEQIDANL